jgi:hypothetical protein
MLTITATPAARLIDAIAAIRDFLDTVEDRDHLTSHELRSLEHLLDGYQLADEAFAQELEGLIRVSAPRPRR